MKIGVFLLLGLLFSAGCVSRGAIKTFGDWRYAQGLAEGRREPKPLQDAHDKCVDDLTQLKTIYYGSIQQQRNAKTDK